MPDELPKVTWQCLGEVGGEMRASGLSSSLCATDDDRESPAPEARIRLLAAAAGEDPDAVLSKMRMGGPLANIIRHILDIPVDALAKPRSGRKPDDEKAWLVFCLVVWNRRRVYVGEASTGRGAALDAAADEWAGCRPKSWCRS